MRVQHIAYSMTLRLGASRAAHAIYTGLMDLGVDCHSLVCTNTKRTAPMPNERLAQHPKDLLSRVHNRWNIFRHERELARYAGTFQPGAGTFAQVVHGLGPRAVLGQIEPADLYHLHWTGDFIDIARVLPALAARAPVVFTPQDDSSFTGACWYSLDCNRFEDTCGQCPQLGSTRADDLTHRGWRHRHRHWRGIPQDRVFVAGISRWLTERIGRSSLLGRFDRECVPSAIDHTEFTPGSPAEARERLGIPADARVVLFVAAHLKIPTKGYDYLLRILPKLRDIPNIYLLSIGKSDPPPIKDIPSKHLGQVVSGEGMRDGYRAADVFANPTRAEAFGLTTIESMACGTPVVGFATSGLLDTVTDGETGFLVPPDSDPALMADRIRRILEDPALRQSMSEAGLRAVRERYTRDIQARRYQAIYEQMLARK